jgi:hypothetical protein
MQRKDHSILLITVFLILTLVFSFLLFKNMTKVSKAGENPVIGNLSFKRNTIERKYDFEVIWDRLESGVEIRNRDTIRTGDYSDAVLTLLDDAKISINENSMIYLDFSDSNTINFAYGSISLLNRGKGENPDDPNRDTIKINTGEKIVEVLNSEVNLEKTGKEELKFEVKTGTAKIIGNGEEQIVNTNQIATLNESVVTIKEMDLLLEQPEDNAVIAGKTNTIPVEFQYNYQENSAKVRLEISNDSRFSKVLRAFDVKKSKSLKISLDPGRYYWRLTSQENPKKQKEISGFRKFQVLSVVPPQLITPKNNQTYTYTNLPPIIEFFWMKNESFSDYRVDISKNSNFTDVLKKISTSNNHATVDKLEDGKYYAKLLAFPSTPDVSPGESEIISFEILNKTVPDPPILTLPIDNQVIPIFSIKNNAVDFSWRDSSELKSYTMHISSTKDFSKLIYNQTFQENYVKPDLKLNPGVYYWRIQGSTKNNVSTEFSKPNRFSIAEQEKIETISPSPNQTLSADTPIVFRWKKVDLYPNFLLEISKNSSFNSILVSKSVSGYSDSLELKEEGNYYWRVRLLSKEDNEIVSSQTNSFYLETIQDPVLLFPKDGDKVDMANNDFIQFKWKEDKKASNYILRLYQIKAGNEKLIGKPINTKNSTYKFTDLTLLDEGNFKWSIQSFFGKEKSSEEIKSNFKIILSNKPEAPKFGKEKEVYVE